MDTLVKRIKSLPKELQDLISEYNVEHRRLLYNVINDVIKYIFYTEFMFHAQNLHYVHIEIKEKICIYDCVKCDNCFIWVEEMNIIKNRVYYKSFNVCSELCNYEYTYKVKKRANLFYPGIQL